MMALAARLRANLSLCLIGWALCHAASAAADEAAKTETPLNDSDREHWSFVPPQRPPLPAVRNAAWCRTPIDRFILAKLEAAGLSLAPDADSRTMLRRLTFDLTGLPPTVDAVRAVATQQSSENEAEYVALVNRLLASRAYAERQAQHWLDLARFAETDGYEHDNVRPEAWRYRDWVIDAFAKQMPLDQFIRLQIAGDELSEDEASAVATGFLLCGPDMPDLNRQDERRSMVLNEITGTIGSTLLGLTIGCAECHDHKFEPLSQADFYRLRACLETADFLSAKRRDEDGADDARLDSLRIFRETGAAPPQSFVLVRGDFQRQGPEVEVGFPRVANPMNATVESELGDDLAFAGSGRRTALAKWLTRADQPLVPRVLVNRIWQQHFGRGLVSTASDFGYLGEAPTHPELLDWLAVELVESGWNLAHLQRLIVRSSVYRQAGARRPEAVDRRLETGDQRTESDLAARRPPAELFADFPLRRLDGEQIRDGMLSAAGRLSERRGGPGIMPPLPAELLASIRKDHWKVDPDRENHRRRSVYLFVRRNLRIPMLDAFDRPDTVVSCSRRNTSTTAPQSLVLLNSAFSQQAAEELAARLSHAAPSDVVRQIEFAYEACLARRPTPAETAAARELIAADAAGLRDFCLALFNLNEFVYVD